MKRTRFKHDKPADEDPHDDDTPPAASGNGVGVPGLPALLSGRTGGIAKIKTPEEFDELVDGYVAHCMASREPITFNGMQLWLGCASHQAFYWHLKRDGFKDSVARAQKIVEYAWEMRLCGNQCTGAIFALKNMGWRDERGAAGAYARRDGYGRSLPPIGSADRGPRGVEYDDGQDREEGQLSIDVSALDDETLESLMNAVSQETVTRESAPGGGGFGRTH